MNYRGMLLGVAVGDAFGAGVEFQSREWIAANVDFTRYIDMRQNPRYQPGFYTDDTEHTVGVIEALMSDAPFTVELLLEAWRAEWASDRARKGFERDGHGSIKRWYRGEETLESIRARQRARVTPGNAPPMRAIPLGCLEPGPLQVYATINAETTHPHPHAIAASRLVASLARDLCWLRGAPETIAPRLLDVTDHAPTCGLLEAIDALPAPSALTPRDWTVLCGQQPMPYPVRGPLLPSECYGLPCDAMRTAVSAVYVCKHARDAFDALRIAVGFGGDVDSIAAIAVGVTGGRCGLESIPSFIFDDLEGKTRLENLADRFETFVETRSND